MIGLASGCVGGIHVHLFRLQRPMVCETLSTGFAFEANGGVSIDRFLAKQLGGSDAFASTVGISEKGDKAGG